jgi:hypothetical protein
LHSAERRDHEIVSGETGGRALFFSRLGYGGNRSPEPVEGNAEPRFSEAGRKQVAEKTSPGALERKKGFHGLRLFQLRMFYGVKAIIELWNNGISGHES